MKFQRAYQASLRVIQTADEMYGDSAGSALRSKTMRVTDRQAFDAMNRQITDARTRTMKAQEQATSGLKVARPSDDPVAAAAARRESARKVYAESATRNTNVAYEQLESKRAGDKRRVRVAQQRQSACGAGQHDTGSAENRRAIAVLC